MKRLENKVAIITGAARGIGFSIAEMLSKQGATSVIVDLNQEAVDAAVQQIDDMGNRAIGFAADVTNSEDIASIFKNIHKEFGKIDILINNAGITKDGLIMKMKESDWDAVINVNLKGTFICTQKVSRYMLKNRSGVILNIASVIGLMGNAGQANYSASKAGVIGFTKTMARELSSRNINVNAIAPGFIETDMTSKLNDNQKEALLTNVPLKRMGQPEDIAKAVAFLCSSDADYITGQVLTVDGGMVM